MRVGRPTPYTDRHRMVRKGEDEHVRLKRRRVVTSALLLQDACLRGAREAQAPVSELMGAAFRANTPTAEFLPRLRGTEPETRVPVAEFRP